MDQRDDNILLFEGPVKAGAAANQLIDFSSDFDAAEACSHHNKAQMPALAVRVGRCFGLLHLPHDVLAKINGVAHDLEGKSMLGHPGDNAQVTLRSAGDYDLIIVQTLERAGPIVKFDL